MNARRSQQPNDEMVAYERIRDEDDATKTRGIQKLTHIQRFVSAIFADPAMLDDIPDGAAVILLPRDDPEAAAGKIEASRMMAEAGQSVQIIPI
jgi:Family of unknown function (DUF5647)